MITTEKLLKHMAWANTEILSRVAQLPDVALDAFIVNPDWTVREIIHHYVRSAHFYGYRLQNRTPEIAQSEDAKRDSYPFNDAPQSGADVAKLVEALKSADAVLLEESRLPEGTVYRVVEGQMIERSRSTILSQAVHHATEHRAQFVSALEARGYASISLDDFDLWAFADAFGE